MSLHSLHHQWRQLSTHDSDEEEQTLPPPRLLSDVLHGNDHGRQDEDAIVDFCEAPLSLSRVDRPATVVIVADKGVVKTTLAAALVMAFRGLLGLDLEIALPTSDDPTYFANILPESLVRRKAVPATEALSLLAAQRKLQAENASLVSRTCMVLDNFFFANADFKGMTDFFQNAHNANILPIFTTTDPSMIPKQLRDTTDFVFIARSMGHNTRKKCWQTFGDISKRTPSLTMSEQVRVPKCFW
jgi:hypothetical protein